MESKTLKKYKRSRFESGDFGDCWFEIKTFNQSPQKLSAIKTILSLSSPVFNELLNGTEDKKGESTIIIENCAAASFQKLLDFIQWEEIDLQDVSEAFVLIELSRKYEIPDLEDICQQFLGNNCDPKNACVIFEQAKQLEINGLVDKALTVIKAQTQKVFGSPAILNSKLDTIMTILDQDTLSIDSEMEVFEMVREYAAHNGLKVDIIGDEGDLSELVKKIRFMAVTPTDFALKPLLSDLLTARQKNAIIGKLLLPQDASHAFPIGFTLKNERIHYTK